MTNLFSLSDLNTSVNHEPRLMDLVIAERLGFDRPRDIRKIIERNMKELTTYGTCATVARVIRGNETKEYYLNEGQALLICALSRTKQAAKVRKALIDVFMSWRRGELKQETRRQLPPSGLPGYAYGQWRPGSMFLDGMRSQINSHAHTLAVSSYGAIRRELKKQALALMAAGKPVVIDELRIEIRSPEVMEQSGGDEMVPERIWKDVLQTFAETCKKPTAQNVRRFSAAVGVFRDWDAGQE